MSHQFDEIFDKSNQGKLQIRILRCCEIFAKGFQSKTCWKPQYYHSSIIFPPDSNNLLLKDGSGVGLITKVVSHPTLPLTITAHEDRHIRFFDNNTGKQTHVMVAHLDAVTSLAIDTNGLYLISGSKSFQKKDVVKRFS